MRKLLLSLIVLLLLQGCELIPLDRSREQTVVASHDEDYLYYYIAHSSSQPLQGEEGEEEPPFEPISNVQTESSAYGHLYTFNGEKSLILTEVVSKMAEQLLYNFPRRYYKESIALTSMVDLNNLKETSWLGQTISELFIHELHIRRLHVVDFKLTGNIQLTEQGEFALTRDWKKLNKDVDVERILTGTMSRNEEGIMVNVRIVNVESNIVESTSSAFIPNNIFVGGEYDYNDTKYYYRNSSAVEHGKSQVSLVK